VTALAADARELLVALAMIAAHGTLLAVLASVAVRLARPRPSVHAALWLVVVAKFALPWSPALPWSLADLLAMVRAGDGVVTVPALPVDGTPSLAPVAPWLGWLALALIWCAGVAFVVGRAVIADRRAYRAARVAAPAPEQARSLLAALHPRARLAIGDGAHGPFVVGIVRPVIVIPPALLDTDPALLRAALLHELAHVRRLDAVWRLLQLVAGAAFWWFPVVRLVNRRLDAARESACDAWALSIAPVSRPAYARLLVRMAQLHGAAAPALATPHALGTRIADILGGPVAPRATFVHAIALVAWIAVALGSARTAEARGELAVCVYNSDLAQALHAQFPEADADGDGVLSHDEACELQAELTRRAVDHPLVSTMDEATRELLAEPLCCNCSAGEGTSRPAVEATSCTIEGVDR
jgi:beta-lactamase regulating signal transducer with metallopeptidase domain